MNKKYLMHRIFVIVGLVLSTFSRQVSTAVAVQGSSETFADVPSTYWAYSYIEQLYNAGVTGGCLVTPMKYCPDATVTRAQIAVFLLKGIHGSSYTPPAIGVNSGFNDVPVGYWAAAWIKQLAAEGITGGCTSGNYCPETTVTRAQMAVFLLRAKQGTAYAPSAPTGVFTDVPVGFWADRWIEQLAVEGITGGVWYESILSGYRSDACADGGIPSAHFQFANRHLISHHPNNNQSAIINNNTIFILGFQRRGSIHFCTDNASIK